MMRADDLAPLLASQPAPGVGFRQGTVLAWDADTADNVIEVGGSQVSNLTVLSASEVKVIQSGDRVSILTLGQGAKSWFILGKVTVPGGAELAIAQSANYVPATSGYTLNRDGFAEFQDVTARGDLQVNSLLAGIPGAQRIEVEPAPSLFVYDATDEPLFQLDTTGFWTYDPNTSNYIRIRANPAAIPPTGSAVIIEVFPGNLAGHTVNPGKLVAANFLALPATQPVLFIESPQIDTKRTARINLTGENADSSFTDSISYLASRHVMSGDVEVNQTGGSDGNLTVDRNATVAGNLTVGTGSPQTVIRNDSRQFIRISGAAETRVNNTFANSALTLPVVASATYTGRCVLWMDNLAVTTADAQFRFAFPANATFSWGPHGLNNGAAFNTSGDLESQSFNGQTTSPSSSTPVGLSTVTNLITLEFIIKTGATAGNVTLQWAQNTTNASASRLLIDSNMVMIREA